MRIALGYSWLVLADEEAEAEAVVAEGLVVDEAEGKALWKPALQTPVQK